MIGEDDDKLSVGNTGIVRNLYIADKIFKACLQYNETDYNAAYSLGWMYVELEYNVEKGMEVLKRCANPGNIEEARRYLYAVTLEGKHSVVKDPSLAWSYMLEAAIKNNSAIAKYTCAWHYFKGDLADYNVPRDEVKGLELLDSAAALHHASSLYLLGQIHSGRVKLAHPELIQISPNTALTCFHRAARLGHKDALYTMTCYPQLDEQTRMRYLLKASKRGSPACQGEAHDIVPRRF